jgi:hypothetical protein
VLEFFARLNPQVVDAHPAWAIFHAGAVELPDGALVSFGLSGAGKSTLTAALVQRGAGYLTDEASLIEPGTELVHPYAKPLSLDLVSLELLEFPPRFDGPSAATEVAVTASELGGRAVREPVRLWAFCHVVRGAGEIGTISQLDPAGAVMAMLPSYMCFDPDRNPLAELSRLVQAYPVWEVRGGTPHGTAAALEGLTRPDAGRAIDVAPFELPPVDHVEDCEPRSTSHLGPFSAPIRQSALVGVRFVDSAVVLDRSTGEHVQMSPAGFDVLAGLDGATPVRAIAHSVGGTVSNCVEFARALADRGWLQGYRRTLDLPIHPHVRDREVA